MIVKKWRVIPFTSIIGQEEMKKALILNVINPKIGGVLIRGEKGTAKSTAVRGLAELLPEIEVVNNCPFSCNPNKPEEMCVACHLKWEKGESLEIVKRKVRVINLPLGATEDRVVGSIDFERAIKKGIKAFEPGLLASANRGMLYIDEVNLLDDHIADLLLDSAALGVNVVEREGIEVSHPANFTLIGTMNPEEGEIRPQLLDRFGLQVTVKGLSEIDERIAIVKIINKFDRDSGTYIEEKYGPHQKALAEKIVTAMGILNEVKIHEDLVEAIASLCVEFDIKTHRAEVATLRTSLTLAAFDGRKGVLFDDIREALYLTLPHRMRRKPFEPLVLDREKLDKKLDDWKKKTHKSRRKESNEEKRESAGNHIIPHEDGTEEERVFEIENQIDPRKLKYLKKNRVVMKSMLGRRIRTISPKGGTYVRPKIPGGKIVDIAIDATIRAAAPHMRSKTGKSGGIKIKIEDIREKIRIGKISTPTVFVVDTSGSMSANERIKSARGAVFSMMVDSYQKRDKVGLVAFSGQEGKVMLPLCSSLDWGIQCLKGLAPGGSTPLSSGLQKGLEILLLEKLKNSEAMPVLVLISDGCANVPMKTNSDIHRELIDLIDQAWINKIHMIFIDVEQSEISDYYHGHFYKQLLMHRMSYYCVGQLSAGIIKEIVYGEKERLLS